MNLRWLAQAAPLWPQKEEVLFSKAKGSGIRAGLLSRFASRPRDRDRLLPLYRAVVAAGRDPSWYRDGQVPDTLDGRFDRIAAIMSNRPSKVSGTWPLRYQEGSRPAATTAR